MQNTITQLPDPSKFGPDPFTDALWKALSEGFRLSVAERAMQRFPRMRGLRKSAAVHAVVGNAFNSERSLFSRANFKENRTAALADRLRPLRRISDSHTVPLKFGSSSSDDTPQHA